jgi:hypothetical protein
VREDTTRRILEPELEDAVVGDWEREDERQPAPSGWSAGIQTGRGQGSLRQIQAAVKSCVTASNTAALANQAFRCSVSLKKSWK